ncbi:MAG: aminodeoxychorismate synthase component I [Proteobacteria bacterium]|nr:aminodeoxychorismate synthase component I [Pseudomonadota bacterium]NOG59238.1 aminodeoxychorismate synthase component I [Pseudomonadota bacterium]
MKVSELPYCRDSAKLFDKIADESWSMFLDSAHPEIDLGRYDIMVSRPVVTLETYGDTTHIFDTDKNKKILSNEDPFMLVKQYLGDKDMNLSGLPFCGGALGYFSYDLGRKIETLPETAEQDVHMPDMAIGIYDWAVIVDHHVRRAWLASFCRFEQTNHCWAELHKLFSSVSTHEPKGFQIKTDVESNMSKENYAKAFDRIKNYILEGDCYQVNLAQRFSAEFEGDSWSAYLKLREFNPAPFSAYINIPAGSVLSSSPERFLLVNGNQVETKPIKGTTPRSSFAYEDKALAVSLLESEKDRAENLMIVDLLRNDISKSCESGSVLVPKLFSLESYATVHHLVSTISGRLSKDKHALDLLRDCFPGGSITGAPKHRSMEIIEELEPHRRSVYCGSITYIGFDGNMDSNICIRTLVQTQNKLYFHAGGGIVWDSKVDSEYKECFDKAAAMLKLVSHERTH